METKRALVVTRFPFEFDRDTGSQRLLSFIDFLMDDGWAITFVSQIPGADERYSRYLNQRGIPVYAGAGADVIELLRCTEFALALILYWEAAETYIPLIRTLCPAARVIVDTIDLNFLRISRRTFLGQKGEGASSILGEDYGADMVRELNCYHAADAVLTVSRKETDLVGDLLSDPSRAFQVGLSMDVSASLIPYADRKGMLFAGNFWHAPNTAAVEFLCCEILPRLDARITAEHPVYITGNAMNDEVRSYGKGLGFVRMLGWVPDLAPYLERVRVALVPLLYGAGVKGKLIQPLMTGTPVVSTSVGAEGVEVDDGEHVLIADDAAGFARAITRLLKDESLWNKLARSGRDQMVRLYGREVTRTRFLDVVLQVLNREPKAAVLPMPPNLRSTKRGPSASERIREIVGLMLPASALIVLFDEQSGDTFGLGARVRWRLTPRTTEAGVSSADLSGGEIIARLEAAHIGGAEYLLIPTGASWLLEQHPQVRAYLDSFSSCVWADENCRIYRLETLGAYPAH